MKKQQESSPIEVLITIVIKKNAKKAETILESFGTKANLRMQGTGTSNNNTMGFFNFGLEEREVILSVVNKSISEKVLSALNEKLKFEENIHSGIAFTVPLNSIEATSLRTLSKMNLEAKNDK